MICCAISQSAEPGIFANTARSAKPTSPFETYPRSGSPENGSNISIAPGRQIAFPNLTSDRRFRVTTCRTQRTSKPEFSSPLLSPVKWKRETSEERKNDILHSVLLFVLHLVAHACSGKGRRKSQPKEKTPGGKNSKWGGSDPTFRAFSRPKSFWGRSRPGHLGRCLRFFSAGHR